MAQCSEQLCTIIKKKKFVSRFVLHPGNMSTYNYMLVVKINIKYSTIFILYRVSANEEARKAPPRRTF